MVGGSEFLSFQDEGGSNSITDCCTEETALRIRNFTGISFLLKSSSGSFFFNLENI